MARRQPAAEGPVLPRRIPARMRGGSPRHRRPARCARAAKTPSKSRSHPRRAALGAARNRSENQGRGCGMPPPMPDKLIRRHPHVFGDVAVSGSGEVIRNWERIKAEERTQKGQAPRSAIGGVPVSLPALVRAERLTEKAGAVGFDWPDAKAVLGKVREELDELIAAMDAGSRERVEHELGDLLFAVANLGRWMKTHPEGALRGTLRRFESRFHHIERSLAECGKSPGDSTLAEMDALWEEAKRREASAD